MLFCRRRLLKSGSGYLLAGFLSLSFLGLSCDKEPVSPNEDPRFAASLFVNIRDPQSPYGEPPITEIIDGSDGGATVTVDFVTFRWKGSEMVVEYAYRLYDDRWSNWAPDTVRTFSYLENRDYTFEVKGRYGEGLEGDPARVTFTVEAIQGPALVVKPRYRSVSTNEQFVLEVQVEDITDLMLAHLSLSFDPSELKVASVDTGGSFLAGNKGQVVFLPNLNNDSGRLIVDMGVAKGEPEGVTGSGPLVKVIFQAMAVGSSVINIEGWKLRDPNNTPISLSGGVFNGMVEVR